VSKGEQEDRVGVCVGIKNGNCFFGEIPKEACFDIAMKAVQEGLLPLQNVQMICHVDPKTKSWLDLAASGPSSLCAVSPPVPYAVIGEIRDVLFCTLEASFRWRNSKWTEQVAEQPPAPIAQRLVRANQ
jgi:hypothetical protein